MKVEMCLLHDKSKLMGELGTSLCATAETAVNRRHPSTTAIAAPAATATNVAICYLSTISFIIVDQVTARSLSAQFYRATHFLFNLFIT